MGTGLWYVALVEGEFFERIRPPRPPSWCHSGESEAFVSASEKNNWDDAKTRVAGGPGREGLLWGVELLLKPVAVNGSFRVQIRPGSSTDPLAT